MENKKFIKFAGLMIAIVAVIAAIVFFLLNATWTDRFGFTHNANNDASYSSDLNASRSYALVEMNSEILTYSDHKLIETLSPVLVAYSDKYYTTFMFEDGTGLYFPESKLTNGAFYGYVDETGNITQDILYYDFTATTVSTEEIRKSATAESREIYNYYPEDFKNDYISKGDFELFKDKYMYQLNKILLEKEELNNSKSNQDNIDRINRIKKIGKIDYIDRNIIIELIDKILIHENGDIEVIFKYKNLYEDALRYLNS